MDIFYCVQEFLKGINVNTDEIPPERKDIKLIPKAITNVETTLMYLTDLFIFALTMRDRASNDRYGTLIRDAKDYIAQNYSNSDFSLNMIATHIGVSPSYFSSIFKQETGQSLSLIHIWRRFSLEWAACRFMMWPGAIPYIIRQRKWDLARH